MLQQNPARARKETAISMLGLSKSFSVSPSQVWTTVLTNRVPLRHCTGGGPEGGESGAVTCSRVDRDYNIPLRIGTLFAMLATSSIGKNLSS